MGLGKGVELLAPLFVFLVFFLLSHTRDELCLFRTHADWERRNCLVLCFCLSLLGRRVLLSSYEAQVLRVGVMLVGSSGLDKMLFKGFPDSSQRQDFWRFVLIGCASPLSTPVIFCLCVFVSYFSYLCCV